MTDARTPPQDLHAERAVLGSVMLAPECWDVASTIVRSEDFYKDAHTAIWESACSLGRDNRPIDREAILGHLTQTGKLERAGGLEYVLSLTDTIPTVANAEHHATRVRNLSAVRAMIHAAYGIVARAYSDLDDIQEFIDQAVTDIGVASEECATKLRAVSMDEAVQDVFQDLVMRSESGGGVTGHRCGLVDLDERMCGFNPSDLIVVAGRPGSGKTSLGANIAQGVAALSDDAVLFFSLEMPVRQLAARAITSAARFDMNAFRRGKIIREDWPRLTATAGELAALPIDIYDKAGISVLDVKREIRATKRRFAREKRSDGNPRRLVLVIVDYLQLLKPPMKCESREQAVGEVSKTLKAIAKDEDVCIVALAQLNRGVTKQANKRPTMADLRESGQIEQDADGVLLIYRDETYNPDTEDKGIAEIIIDKQRNGQTGTVRLRYTPEFTRFDNLSHDGTAGGWVE